MTTQYFKSNGEVMLSRWWRTQSARAAFRRVKLERTARFKELAKRKAAKLASLVAFLVLATSSMGALYETPEQFEPGTPESMDNPGGEGELLVWEGKHANHAGAFSDGKATIELFWFSDRRPMTGREMFKFLKPYEHMQMSLPTEDADITYWRITSKGRPYAVIEYNRKNNTLLVETWAWWNAAEKAQATDRIEANKDKTEAEEPRAKDCVILAAENLKRLEAVARWAKIFAFHYTIDGETASIGHAVVVFKLTDAGQMMVVDKTGTAELWVTDTSLETIKAAMSAKLTKVYCSKIELTDAKFLK